MRRLLLTSLFLAVGACTAHAVPPVGFPMALTLTDTAKVTVPCPSAGPNIGCVLSASDSVSGTVLWTNRAFAVGESVTATLLCSAPGAKVVVRAVMVGVAPGVPNSLPANGRGEGTCPLPGAVSPTVTIQIIFATGGP